MLNRKIAYISHHPTNALLERDRRLVQSHHFCGTITHIGLDLTVNNVLKDLTRDTCFCHVIQNVPGIHAEPAEPLVFCCYLRNNIISGGF